MKNGQINLLVVGVGYPLETFIMQKLRALADNGCNITVYSAGGKIKDKNLTIKNLRNWGKLSLAKKLIYIPYLIIISCCKHPLKSFRMLRLSLRDSSGPKEFAQGILHLLPLIGEEPDLLHFEWNSAAVEFETLCEYYEKPYVVSCRGSQINIAPLNPQRKDQVDGIKRTLKNADAIHCVSESVSNNLRNLEIEAENVFINRPAVDTKFFYPLESKVNRFSNEITIVSVGSLNWNKGYEYALQSMRHLLDRERHIQYRIIGNGSDEDRLRYTVTDLGLEGVVHLMGHLHPNKVRDQLRGADIYLLSSLSEGISNTVLEAMACGLPVVTTECGGMREAVTDGIEGFVVPVRSPITMAEKLERLIDDVGLRTRMGNAGRDRVEQEFTIERQAQHFMHEYRRLLGDGQP